MSRRLVEPAAGALLAVCLGCAGSQPGPATPNAGAGEEVTRFRLPLSDNPIDPGAAFRCHADCQEQDTPDGYLQCLSGCPGFEQTPGIACAPNEIPPLAACFTARPAPEGSEPRTGSVVVAIIRNIPVVVGVAAVCASQTEPCSYGGAGLVP
jgi:hypothetical protein